MLRTRFLLLVTIAAGLATPGSPIAPIDAKACPVRLHQVRSGGAAPTPETRRGSTYNIATLFERSSAVGQRLVRLDEALRVKTQCAEVFKIYPSGVSGGDDASLRKMRKHACLEGAVLTPEGLSQVVPELAVLDVPGSIKSYGQLAAVLRALGPRWEAKLEQAGFTLIAWQPLGQYRWFTKTKIERPEQLLAMRRWRWKDNPRSEAAERFMGGKLIPLVDAEIYAALDERFVDAVSSTAFFLMSRPWHKERLGYATQETFGMMVGALVIRKEDGPSAEAIRILKETVRASEDQETAAMRAAEIRAMKSLIAQRYVVYESKPEVTAYYAKMAQAMRQEMTGQLFTPELLREVEAAAAAAPDMDSAMTDATLPLPVERTTACERD